ncbi:MAG: hypothetical protein ACI8RZ_005122 [Myxococcota bacterium]|jgi:hypothetical protein
MHQQLGRRHPDRRPSFSTVGASLTPSSPVPTSLVFLFTMAACSERTDIPPESIGEPVSPASPAPPASPPHAAPSVPPSPPEAVDEWVTTSGLDFGPPGATLRRTNTDTNPQADVERQLVLPSPEGEQILAMNEGVVGEDIGPCTMTTMSEESIFVVDTDGDGVNELFVAWTWMTGVGHDGAVDNLDVCGWRWTGTELVYLSELSRDLSFLGMRDADAVTAYTPDQSRGPWEPHGCFPIETSFRLV